MEDTYNGWANRETWALTLHISNDEGLHTHFTNLVAGNDHLPDHNLIELIRAEVENLFSPGWWVDELGTTMPEPMQDMVREVGSLWRVDWDEVLESLKEN